MKLTNLVNSVEFSLKLTKRDTEAIVRATLQNLLEFLPPEEWEDYEDERDAAYVEGKNTAIWQMRNTILEALGE